MKNLCKWIGLISLIIIFVMPIAHLFDAVSFDGMKAVLLGATLVWFGTSVFWIGTKKGGQTHQQDS